MNTDLSLLKNLKALLLQHKIRPLKKYGQNFLIDKNTIKTIIKTADLSPKDTVLEIGPGCGILTKELAKKVKGVIAVEKDKRMIEVLEYILKDFKNVEIIKKDILEVLRDNPEFLTQNYKVVANLPYHIASLVIKKFLELKHPPSLMVLMVQKEVGERICSQPPKMAKLGVFIY